MSTASDNLPAQTLDIAPIDLWHGDSTLLARRTAAILNSRQGKYPCGEDKWVKQTVRTATWIVQQETTLIAGLGLPGWELGIWAVSEALGTVVILMPFRKHTPKRTIEEKASRLLIEFGLLPQNALVVPYYLPNAAQSEKKTWRSRDEWIINKAHSLFPVSLRPKGFMDRTVAESGIKSKTDFQFQIKYEPPKSYPLLIISEEDLSPRLELTSKDYLIHWTRRSSGPWPGESRSRFYRNLNSSAAIPPHMAFATLMNIIDEGTLRGTSWRMPSAKKMVSFSETSAARMINLMGWQRRYVRPRFEPYGIAISKEKLGELGARIVKYGSHEERLKLSVRDRLYFQTAGENSYWPIEEEWRLEGNLELSSLSSEDILIIVHTEEDALEMEKLYSLRSIAMRNT